MPIAFILSLTRRIKLDARYDRRLATAPALDPMSDDAQDPPPPTDRPTPGGPYFGRLLIVLFIAVAFCAFMTWLLNTLTAN